MFATSTPVNGWHAVQARGNGIVVDAFAHDRDVHCDVGSGGGFETRGTAAGGGDGTRMAREATLPKETMVFADAARTVPVAVVHRAVRALQTEDGSWRGPALSDRGATLVLNAVYVDDTHVKLGPLVKQGVGSSWSMTEDWPTWSSARAP